MEALPWGLGEGRCSPTATGRVCAQDSRVSAAATAPCCQGMSTLTAKSGALGLWGSPRATGHILLVPKSWLEMGSSNRSH